MADYSMQVADLGKYCLRLFRGIICVLFVKVTSLWIKFRAVDVRPTSAAVTESGSVILCSSFSIDTSFRRGRGSSAVEIRGMRVLV